MTPYKSSQILDWVLDENIPPHINLTGRVMAAVRQTRLQGARPHLKLATSLLIAFAALLILSSAVYAVYRLMIDPGLHSVQDAGLVQDVGASAQPSLLPSAAASPVPPTAMLIDQSQTVEGISMTLDWVYLDETRLLFGIHFSGLPAGVSVGFAKGTVNGDPLGGQQQESEFLQATRTQAIYLSNQVTQAGVYGNNVDLTLDIPLLRSQDGAETQAAVYQFKLDQVPLNQGRTLGFDQSAATNVNGVEMQLHSLRLTPDAIEAVVCPSPLSSAVFSVQQAALSAQGINEREFIAATPVDDQAAFCQKLSFDPQGLAGTSQLTLTVNKDWKFTVDLPSENQIPGVKPVTPQSTPQPVAAQSIDQISLTLDWVFADAKRIAFGYTLSGLPDLPDAFILGGTIAVTDVQGNPIGGGYGGSSSLERSSDQSGALSGTWSTVLQQPLSVDQISLKIDITLDGTHGNDWNYTIGNVLYPASGPTAEMVGSIPQVIPGNLVGTYHFEVTTQVYPVTTLLPGQVVEANGIQMELLQAELTPSYSDFILCYTKPSAEDWMIGNAVLTSGVEQASIQGYSLLTDNNHSMTKIPVTLPPTSLTGENVRCAKVEFMLGHSNQARTITLTIPGLERSVPEVIPQAELDVSLAKLREQGIEMTYSVTRGVGGGGGGPEYTQLPEGMTQKEAYDRFMDALGYRVPGSWVFTFPFQP